MPERASYVRTFRRATTAEEPRAEAEDDTEPVFDKRLLTEEERPKRAPPSHPPPEQFRWKKKGRKIQIFHNPDDPTSCRVLKLLERARAEPFPPKSKHSQEPKLVKRRRRGGPTHILPPPPPPPLEYELHVRVGPPTAEQFRVLMALVSERAPSYVKAFLDPSQARYGAHATNERELAALVTADKRLLLWPIVVSWPARWAAVGSYKQVYAFLRRIADRRPLPKLEGTPVFDPEILAREVVQGPSYLAKHLTASDLAELEDITA